MIPQGVLESQTALFGTSLSAGGYRCMVPGMSGLLRWARPCVVALLTVALVLGINGLEGAIHSVHHLPAPVESNAHDHSGHGHDTERGAPVPGTEEPCPVAAAASHIAATAVEVPPGVIPLAATAVFLTLGSPDAPRIAWREPGSGRAPPFVRSLPS